MKLNLIVNSVAIAPHGITDLIHAYTFDNMKNLRKIYIRSFCFSLISNTIHVYNNNINLIDGVFLISSIFHFRHDIPKSITNPILWTTILVTLTPIIGIHIFTLYMIFIHVPRHYKKCWYFLRYQKLEAILLILIVAATSYHGFLLFNILNKNSTFYFTHIVKSVVKSVVKSIIISHVIYNEKYIDI
jgi:hypothetical protein